MFTLYNKPNILFKYFWYYTGWLSLKSFLLKASLLLRKYDKWVLFFIYIYIFTHMVVVTLPSHFSLSIVNYKVLLVKQPTCQPFDLNQFHVKMHLDVSYVVFQLCTVSGFLELMALNCSIAVFCFNQNHILPRGGAHTWAVFFYINVVLFGSVMYNRPTIIMWSCRHWFSFALNLLKQTPFRVACSVQVEQRLCASRESRTCADVLRPLDPGNMDQEKWDPQPIRSLQTACRHINCIQQLIWLWVSRTKRITCPNIPLNKYKGLAFYHRQTVQSIKKNMYDV